MGSQSRANRRSILECSQHAVGRVNDVVKQHNGLLEATTALRSDLELERSARADGETRLQQRLSAQGAMIEALETAHRDLVASLEAQRNYARDVDRRCDRLESALSEARGLANAVADDFLDYKRARFFTRLRRLLPSRATGASPLVESLR